MNKKPSVFKIMCAVGIIVIVFGILLTVIPLFNFSGSTFRLIPAMLSGLAMPLVGMVIIVVCSIVATNNKSDDEIDNISAKVKKKMAESGENKSQSEMAHCEYCGCNCKKEDKKCPHCGAKIK